MKQYT